MCAGFVPMCPPAAALAGCGSVPEDRAILSAVPETNYASGVEFVVEFLGYRFGFNAVDFEQRVSAAAVKLGLAEDPGAQTDLDEARKLINALAGLITAGAPEISDMHARSLRDGLRSLQLAFREASVIPDPIGKGPGEKWTGPVN